MNRHPGTHGSWYKAELQRWQGEILNHRTPPQSARARQAETAFEAAISTAQQQEARLWELRATVSLCRLWQRQGKLELARERLIALYGWFTEGFATADLQEAKALLEALG
ncbi:MAG: hypothetical protein AB7G75_37275 [Candidatus Binatia bacterium]